jgi:YidC/Oxa1 family membrane protein insertase
VIAHLAGILLPLANILKPIEDVDDSVLHFLAEDLYWCYGVAIIMLTFVTRIVILPLSIRQIKSMRALQAYAPQIKQLNERYKDDPQRKQRELMDFDKSNNINPLASCFPLLLQLPVFFALFQLLRSDGFQAEGAQRIMLFALPVVFTPFIISFPAGLILYWITTNVWTIGQQYVVKDFWPAPPIQTVDEIKAAKPPPPPPRKKKRRR